MSKLNRFNKIIGWGMVGGLSFFPVLLWAMQTSLLARFGMDFDGFMLSLGQIAALVGTAMFALSLILSGRFKFMEKYFGGLNGVYERHGQLGQVALMLLLLHPLLILFQYTDSFYDAIRFLTPGTNLYYNFGVFSLGLMIFLIVLTLYLRPKYNIWIWTHKFLGLAFFLGALHVWFIPSDTSRYLPLRVYMLGLAGLGLLVFLYKTIFGKFLVSKLKYEIVALNKLNNVVLEIVLKPTNSALKFSSGQFVFIQFLNVSIGSESHPFSIVSSPSDDLLKIAVKNLGDFTSRLDCLSVGTEALVEGPFGMFSYKNSTNKNQVWIAGGVGITPFVSMARTIMLDDETKIDLLYCVKNNDEALYLNDLQQIALESNGKFALNLFCSDIKGRVNIEGIKANISGKLEEKDFYICASPVMIQSLAKQLVQNGVLAKNIHSEEFNF